MSSLVIPLRPRHQPGREPGAGDQPGGQLRQRAINPGEGREAGGYSAHGRTGGGTAGISK